MQPLCQDIRVKNHGFNILVFRYEDLLTSQEGTLRKVIDFLDIEWHNNLMDFHQKNPTKILAGGTRSDMPVNQSRANSSPSCLNPDEQRKISLICHDLMSRYNYAKV